MYGYVGPVHDSYDTQVIANEAAMQNMIIAAGNPHILGTLTPEESVRLLNTVRAYISGTLDLVEKCAKRNGDRLYWQYNMSPAPDETHQKK